MERAVVRRHRPGDIRIRDETDSAEVPSRLVYGTYKTTKSGNAAEFCNRAPCRWLAKTAGLMRFLAQLNVMKSRSSVDGAILWTSVTAEVVDVDAIVME